MPGDMSVTLLVCGAGMAGLTAALAGLKAGFAVRVFERAERLSEVGAGLQLGPNAMKVMRALGLEAAICAAGHRPARLEFRRGGDGSLVFALPAAETARRRWGAPYVNIQRAALQEILVGALQQRAQGALTLAAESVDHAETGAGIALHLADGRRVEGDYLIGADGLHSAVRARMLEGERPRYTGHTAWRLMVEASPALRAEVPDASAVWTGPGRHAVTYYLGGRRRINFVGVVERAEPASEDWLQPGQMDELRAAFSDFAAPVRALLAAAERTRLWGLYDRPAPSRLADGRAVLIGDAAHPMPPFMAQGAALGMEAAWSAIWSLKTTGEFRAHERAIRRRAARLLAASRRNGALFHERGLPATFGYAPVAAAARLAPGLISRQFDWVYRHDPTAGRPLQTPP